MKLFEIPAHLGVTQKHLADLMGVSKQVLGQYLLGKKGKESKFIGDLLQVASLQREDIVFPDFFQHPDGESPEHSAYWANIALEAINEAIKRGAPLQDAQEIIKSIISHSLEHGSP